MQKKKKKWITPQLIVLVRGKPEEVVLIYCKTWGDTVRTLGISGQVASKKRALSRVV